MNSIDLAIKCTLENNEDGAIPFLDTIVKPEANGRLSTKVYRKLTYMDQCLQWDSHHHLSVKYSVFNMLAHRTKSVINLSFSKKKKIISGKHSLTVSTPNGPFDRVERRLTKHTSRESIDANNQGTAGTKPRPMKLKPMVT